MGAWSVPGPSSSLSPVSRARSYCASLGEKWMVSEVGEGSLVCSSVDPTWNCNGCLWWRIVAFGTVMKETGQEACPATPCAYYCGHGDIPCTSGCNFLPGGIWAKEAQEVRLECAD